MKHISQYTLIVIIAIFFTLFYNFSFFTNVVNTYPLDGLNIVHFFSVGILLTSLVVFLFTLFSSEYTTKPILIITLVVSSFAAYFMDTYHVVIDDSMIRNSLQTNLSESSDLFSLKLVLYIFLLGVLPSYFVYKTQIKYKSFKQEFFAKLKTICLSLAVVLIILFSFSKFYTSFLREHKPLRYHVNPIYWIYSIGNYINKSVNSGPIVVKQIGLDAKINEESHQKVDKTELIIMVVGEAARANRFS
ncbi:MAG: DUF1705 domain-containing protein, partial [Aliarcobacter sp.]|nr:DUF1705 domain-containing protein [Aliarcobacter sp.]